MEEVLADLTKEYDNENNSDDEDNEYTDEDDTESEIEVYDDDDDDNDDSFNQKIIAEESLYKQNNDTNNMNWTAGANTTYRGQDTDRTIQYTKTTTYSTIDAKGNKKPKKKTVQTYITASGKAVQTKDFDEPLSPEMLKLKPFEREKVEVKTVLVKPVVNAMYDTQTITTADAKNLARSIKDEEVIAQSSKYKNKSIDRLMENYSNITKASSVCCVSNLAANLKKAGLKSENILDVLKYDARRFYVQDTCLILSNEDIDNVFNTNGLSTIVKDTRKSCLCANKVFMRKNIASFYKIYKQDPDFYKKALLYRYKDKQGRITEHDINETILNIADTLNECP